MRFSSSWLRHSTRFAPAAGPRIRTSPRERADFRPRLEALENRWLFSTLTVTSDQDSGAGSLRDTIAAAQSGDTIVFSVTPTSGTTTITLTSGQLLLAKDLTIQGPGAGQLVISGSPILGTGSRAFEVAQGSAVTLSGMTVDGFSDYWASYPVVTPWAGYGGGILNHGTLTASGCTFNGVIRDGEGGAIFSDGTLTLSACTVSDGIAHGTGGSGAGISNWGTATLTNTIISNNAARPNASLSYPWFNKGGGILNQGTMTLNGCTVSGNYAREMGGGIFNSGTLILDGSTVSGNSTGNYGGGIYNAGTTTVQNSSSITGNSAPYGADVFNIGVVYQDNTSTIGFISPNPAIVIVPDPNAPQLQIGDVTVTEGNTGTTSATFTVTLSPASTETVSVAYSTATGTATEGSDYQAASGTLTFAPGEVSKTIIVPVYGDRVGEPNETFSVKLSGATNATLGDGQGVGTITDNEPRISIDDVTRYEGKKRKTTLFTFTVTLSAAYDQAVTTSFRTANGTATTGNNDYVAKTGTLTFNPGETTKTITIEVKGDNRKEANESFSLELFGPSSNASLLDAVGLGTILNDD